MKFNFRQGIHSAPMSSGHPSFLIYNPGNNTITISIGTSLIRATAAWKDVNYLIEERENATDTWGPFNNGVGPYYLYWDINLATGALTRGITLLEPDFGDVLPVGASTDQHWFDTSVNVMKVWDGAQWNQKIRVFAASFAGGTNVITEYELGTQVGLFVEGTQETWFDHGYILFGIDQKAIKNSDGSMVTTAVPLNTYHGSFSSPIRLELSNSTSLASESIPSFSAVSAVGDGTIQVANGADVNKRPIGISTVPVITGDPVDIVFKGIVYNDQWDWNYSLGKDLYCGLTGTLMQGTSESNVRVGAILDAHTVLIDVDLYGSSTGGGSDGASGFSGYSGKSGYSGVGTSGFSGYSGVASAGWPLRAPTEYNSPGIIPFSFEDSTGTGVQLISNPQFDPFKWILTYGISPGEFVHDQVLAESVAYDSLGNIYTVGGDTNYSNLMFVVKHDSSGNLIWQKRFDCAISPLPTTQSATAITIDSSNIYIAVTYHDKSPLSAVIKMNVDGDVIWESKLLDPSKDYQQQIRDICTDNGGNVIVTGTAKYTDAFTNILESGFVTKLDSSGAIIWNTYLIGNTSDVIGESISNSVVTDSTNNIYISGSVKLIYDGNYASNNSCGYLTKLNSDGISQWNKVRKATVVSDTVSTPTGYLNSTGTAINADGIYQVSQILNSGVRNAGVLTKFNSSGTVLWETQLNSVSFNDVALDSSGNVYVVGQFYIDGNPLLNYTYLADSLVIAKYNASGVLQWQRVINAATDVLNPIEIRQSTFGGKTIAIHNSYITIIGYSGFGTPTSIVRSVIAQLGTDGSRIDTYGSFSYETSVFEVLTSEAVATTAVLVATAGLTVNNQLNNNYLVGVNNYDSIKPPTKIQTELNFSKDNVVSLKLTSYSGEELVQIDSAQHGLKLTPTQASAEVRNPLFDVEDLKGTVRSVDGRIQTKLELNVGSDSTLTALNGGYGYQAITPYQTSQNGPDISAIADAPILLDYGLSNSIVLYVDPVNHVNSSIILTNGLAGEQCELIYKLANANPVLTVDYKYPQTGNAGFLGNLLIVANESIRDVAVVALGFNNLVSHTTLGTGRPRQIVVSNLWSSDDAAYVSTTGNKIEILGAGDGARIFGATAETLVLSRSRNSINQMDGYMWMNPTTNHLFAVGLNGDIWEIDAAVSVPVELNHITLTPNSQVHSISGDPINNALFILYSNAGILTFCAINCSTLETYLTALGSITTEVVNEMVVNLTDSEVYVTTSDGENLRFISLSTIDLTSVVSLNDQLIPLTTPAGAVIVKSQGALRSDGVVFFPHIYEIIGVDTASYTLITNLYYPANPAPRIDRLIVDPRTNFIIGTSSYRDITSVSNISTPTTVGAIQIATNNEINNYTSNRRSRNFTYAIIPTPADATGSAADFAGLAVVSPSPGEVYVTLDNGISWMCNGNLGYTIGSNANTDVFLMLGTDIQDEKGHSPITGNAVVGTGQALFGTTSYAFNGSSRFVVPSSPDWYFDDLCTIELWVYRNSTADGDLLNRGNASLTEWRLRFESDTLYYNYFNGGSGYGVSSPAGAVGINAWHHIAVTRNKTAAVTKIFVDGIEVASSSSVYQPFLYDTEFDLFIGSSYYIGDKPFDGYMASIHMTKGEVLYTSTFTPVIPYLLGTWTSINENIYFSYPAGGSGGLRNPGVSGFSGISGVNGYDGIEIFDVSGFWTKGFFSVTPAIDPSLFDTPNIVFPDTGVTQLPVPTEYNQTWIAKFTKSSFYDDYYHERQFKWYCTGVSGPYTYPLATLV